MTIEEAIERAIDGGWKTDLVRDGILLSWENYGDLVSHMKDSFLLDPKFWQSLGKAMGWVSKDHSYQQYEVDYHWHYQWHKFIDNLAEGKTIEEFFSKLK